MINVVYLIPSFRKAGPINVVYDIVRHMNYDCYKVTVIALRQESTEQNIVRKFQELGVRTIQYSYVELELFLFPKLVAKRIMKDISSYSNIIIHAHCFHPNVIATYLQGVKIITTTHNISCEDYVSAAGKIMGTLMYKRFNKKLKKFDMVVVLSDYMRVYYKNFSNKIIKIPNGVHASPVERNSIDKLRQKLGVPTDRKILIVAGFVSERKNVEYIIKELNTINLNYCCLIVGNGDRIEECVRATNGNSKIVFTGYKLNVEDYLSVSDIYISASKSEGLPLSVLEAINMGLPSVLSNIPPHREIVDTLGVEGITLFSLNKNGLADCLLKIWHEKFDNSKISKRAKEEYSSEMMSLRYQNLYYSLAK